MGDIWSIKEQYKRQMGNLWGSRGQRGLNAGGVTPSVSDQINYFNISSAGDAVDFGDLTLARHGTGFSSDIRGIFGGGYVAPAYLTLMDYVTMATTGNAADFGDLTLGSRMGDAGAIGGDENTIKDLSGNGNNGTLQNLTDAEKTGDTP
mgnify:CR=1 FL=1